MRGRFKCAHIDSWVGLLYHRVILELVPLPKHIVVACVVMRIQVVEFNHLQVDVIHWLLPLLIHGSQSEEALIVKLWVWLR